MPIESNKPIGKSGRTLEERLTQRAVSRMEKNVDKQVDKRLSSGQSPNDILSGLLQAFESSKNAGASSRPQKPLEQRLIDSSQQLYPTGEKYGLLPTFKQLTSGQFSPMGEKKAPLGMSGAIQLEQLRMSENKEQRDMEKDLRAIPQELANLVNTGYDIAKKQREFEESSEDFKQREAVRGIRNELIKTELIDNHKSAMDSMAAIDAFSSLRETFYEGFEPVDIAKITGRPLDEAQLGDLLFAKGQGAGKVLESMLGKNPVGKAYLRNIQGFATLISRGGFQEKGTLTDSDRKVVVRMFNLAMSNKEEADVAFGVIQNILSKPALRSAKSRIMRLGETIDEVDLPFDLKERALKAKEMGFGDKEIVESLISGIDKTSWRISNGK